MVSAPRNRVGVSANGDQLASYEPAISHSVRPLLRPRADEGTGTNGFGVRGFVGLAGTSTAAALELGAQPGEERRSGQGVEQGVCTPAVAVDRDVAGVFDVGAASAEYECA
jgi:hypothetical protein